MTAAVVHEARALVLAELAEARGLGAAIDRDPDQCVRFAELALGDALNTLGGPDDAGLRGLADRCALYEALGYADPNLAFAAPGPVMAGFVVDGLGDAAQKQRFHDHFAAGPAWSFFALTERHAGTDAGSIGLRATALPGGGFRLDGEKYLIGQGVNATIGVVFARLADGPLGIGAFLLEPRRLPGFSARRLPVIGCRGSNVSHLRFDAVEVAEDALLGRHLRPTERFGASASATFDALRPCVGAIALGTARGVLDRTCAEELLGRRDRAFVASARLTLDATLGRALDLCRAADAGRRQSREAGLVKAQAARLAQGVVDELAARCPAGAAADRSWLARAWRDVRAFEYAEGMSAHHMLNGADLFRRQGHARHH